MIRSYLPFLDLRHYRFRSLPRDLLASPTVTFLDIPQGVAYAMIAGLPPVMGLYAAAVPAIVGALFRSSRHVVTGPTNALSLLVGSAVAAEVARGGASPMEVGITLAFLVGVMQFVAGILRLDALADYISQPVVRGYISGAAILVIIGQLPNATGTDRFAGSPASMLGSWFHSLPEASLLAALFAAGTVVLVVGLRRVTPRLPATIIVMLLSIVLAQLFRLSDAGLQLVADLAPLPTGLPPLTLPHFGLWSTLLPAAMACAVLSLVESSSVARTLAARSGQRLDMATEFAGQGLANIAAAFSGGYPVSGSLARSALNQQAGAQSRLSAMFCGFMMLAVLLFFGPVVNQTPIASLAGLLFVLAIDLIAFERIRVILRGTLGDRAAFLTTLVGTWLFPLDQAIYIGVGISILLFLRRARLLTAREMTIGEKGRFREVDQIDLEREEPGQPGQTSQRCSAIRILNLTGPLFFAVSGELQAMLDRLSTAPGVRVVILRMRQTQGLDITIARLLEASQAQLAQNGKTLLLLGLRSDAMQLFEKTDIAARIGPENLFPAQSGWFTAMEAALRRALALAGEHDCGAACPFAAYLTAQDVLRFEPES